MKRLLPLLAWFALLVPAPAAPDPDDAILRAAELARPVTLRLKKRPLSDVAAALARLTGVPMSAAPDVADEPAIVYAADQPAREVMRQVARHFGYRWTRHGKEGSYRYELFQDALSRKQEQALRDEEQLRVLRALQGAVRRRVEFARRPEEALKLADLFDDATAGRRVLTEAEKAALHARPEWQLMRAEGRSGPLRECAGGTWPVLARLVDGFTPEQWAALSGRRWMRFSTIDEPGMARLPEAITRELRAAQPVMFPPGARLSFAQPDGAATYGRMERMLQDQWRRAAGLRVRIRLEQNPGKGSGKLIARVATVMPPDFGGEQHVGGFPLEVSSGDVARAEEGLGPELEDPALEKRVPWPAPRLPVPPSGELVNELLSHAAGAYGLNLVADAYRQPPLTLPAWQRGAPVSLREIVRSVTPLSRWEKDGAFFRVRRRTWYRDRLAEIPPRILGGVVRDLRKTRVLTTERLQELLSGLRDEQWSGLRAQVLEDGLDLDEHSALHLNTSRDVLRAVGTFTPAQRLLLREGKKVLLRDMPPAAQQRMLVALEGQTEDETDQLPRLTAPDAGLKVLPMRREVQRTPQGFTVLFMGEGDPRLGGPRVEVRAPPEADLRPGVTPAGMVVFAYEYGSASRYFYAPPWYATVEVQGPRAGEAPARAPLE